MSYRITTSAILAASLCFLMGTGDLQAQANNNNNNQGGGGGRNRGNRGGGDPAQFQARRMDRYREQLEVTNDAEWKVIQERIEKVLEAEREARSGGFGGFGGFGGGGPGGGRRGGNNRGNNGGNQADAAGTNADRGTRGGQPNPDNPERTALQLAVDSKASTEELKTKISKLRERTKQKEANLAKAREDLRQVLTVRQEALAHLNGLLR